MTPSAPTSHNHTINAAMSFLLERAAQMNNAGVTALCHGEEELAIELLTSSIGLMKSEFCKTGVDMRALMGTTGGGGDGDSSGFARTVTDSQLSRSTAIDEHTSDEFQDTMMFNQAIGIPVTTDFSQASDLNIHVYSATVIFNLALSHQQKAKSVTRNPISLPCNTTMGMTDNARRADYVMNMQKAGKLYQVTLKLLDDDVAFRSFTGVLVKLAAFNNLSMIRMWMMGSSISIITELTGETRQTLDSFVSQNSVRLHFCMERDPSIHRLMMSFLLGKASNGAPAA